MGFKSVHPSRTILIADRDPDVRAMYRLMLQSHGFVIDESEDGAEALGKALCRPPDVVVADVRLPRIDGVALCQLLSREPTTRLTAVVLVTDTNSSAEHVRTRSAGAARVLLKPFTAEDLAVAVQTTDRPSAEA